MRSLSTSFSRDLALSPRVLQAVGVVLFAALSGLGAFVRIPVPGTPVPLTLQTFFVLLAGCLLGARAGAASQLLYVAAGVAGLPLFAGALAGPLVLLGPTGGYLLGFVVAPLIVARFARSGRVTFGLAAGAAAILVLGAAQLAWVTGLGIGAALAAGVVPFLPGEILEVAAARAAAAATAQRGRR